MVLESCQAIMHNVVLPKAMLPILAFLVVKGANWGRDVRGEADVEICSQSLVHGLSLFTWRAPFSGLLIGTLFCFAIPINQFHII